MNRVDPLFEIALENKVLPSVNSKHHGAAKYYNHKSHLTDLFKLHYRDFDGNIKPPIKSTVRLVVIHASALDIDNPIKAIQDALKDAGIITDDKNICRLEVDAVPNASIKRGRCNALIQLFRLNTSTIVKKEDLLHTYIESYKIRI